MDERIHRVLDEELPREELSPEERRRLAAVEDMLAAAAAAFPTGRAPDLAPAVLRRLEELESGAHAVGPSAAVARVPGWLRIRRWTRWLWTPRPLTVRPAWALATAAALVVAASIPLLRNGESPRPSLLAAADSGAHPVVLVQFRLDAPGASQVALAGDFTGWKPDRPMIQREPGVWTLVVPLSPGVHDYAFVVDGRRWVPDPLAPQVDDGFGGRNSRVSVLAPTGTSSL